MTFEELNLEENLLLSVKDMGFVTPSEVQEKTIPVLLSKKTDLVALAQTGTGKTAAFGLPLIQHIDVSNKSTQGFILSPTRELCLQITKDITQYTKYIKNIGVVAIYGGASITEQFRKVKKGAHIIVATPGRMQDMISRKMVNISAIKYCILDEADEMLNMGFFQDITEILSHTPKDKSTWLFSATMPKEVSTIAKKFMTNPVEITVGNRNQGNVNINHEYYVVNSRDRYLALKRLADFNPEIFAVIFCRTKRDTQNVAERLIEDGYNVAALHGDLSQNQRDMVMKGFRNNQIQLLVATDVAARGIDVENITHVINYQLPDETEIYIHRSGRTGRAGNTGTSIIIATKSDGRKIKQLEKLVQKKIEAKMLPNGVQICEKQLFYLVEKIKTTNVNPEVDTLLPEIYKALQDVDRETLIKKLISVEFTRFSKYYKNSKDINIRMSEGDNYSRENKPFSRSSKKEVRYFINLGEKNGLDWRKLKDLIKEELNLGQDDVFKVDVMEGFSFFNTNENQFEAVMGLNGTKYKGVIISIEKSKVEKKGNNRGGQFREKSNRRNNRNFDGRKKRSF